MRNIDPVGTEVSTETVYTSAGMNKPVRPSSPRDRAGCHLSAKVDMIQNDRHLFLTKPVLLLSL